MMYYHMHYTLLTKFYKTCNSLYLVYLQRHCFGYPRVPTLTNFIRPSPAIKYTKRSGYPIVPGLFIKHLNTLGIKRIIAFQVYIPLSSIEYNGL
jgi:hypothetical protein